MQNEKVKKKKLYHFTLILYEAYHFFQFDIYLINQFLYLKCYAFIFMFIIRLQQFKLYKYRNT